MTVAQSPPKPASQPTARSTLARLFSVPRAPPPCVRQVTETDAAIVSHALHCLFVAAARVAISHSVTRVSAVGVRLGRQVPTQRSTLLLLHPLFRPFPSQWSSAGRAVRAIAGPRCRAICCMVPASFSRRCVSVR